MPFYEYQCLSCKHHLEELQKANDPPLTQCPKCDKEALEKIISRTGFQLMGSGWYETDFKDKKPQPAAAVEETSSAQPEKTIAEKVEKQPEKKTEQKSAEAKSA